MSRRSQARALAEHLTTQAGTPVTIDWDNPSGRPGCGTWRVEWTDGPTTTALRRTAAAHARFLAPLDVAALRWARQYSPTAWAVALLTRAEHATLPDTATHAVALVEYDLHHIDAADWTPTTLRTAADLAHGGHGDPHQMAAALLRARVTKIRDQTPRPAAAPPPATNASEYRYSLPEAGPLCAAHPACLIVPCARFLCTRPVHILRQRGRPRRFCSPTCRVAEHRRLRA